jgi:hypothetical protein
MHDTGPDGALGVADGGTDAAPIEFTQDDSATDSVTEVQADTSSDATPDVALIDVVPPEDVLAEGAASDLPVQDSPLDQVVGDSCQPSTCLALGYECGDWDDGCGGTVSCQQCVSPKICVLGACTCLPKTCADQGIECGPSDDGCGNLLDCKTCDTDHECQSGKCVMIPKCGDGVCDGGETHEACCEDCGCAAPLNCAWSVCRDALETPEALSDSGQDGCTSGSGPIVCPEIGGTGFGSDGNYAAPKPSISVVTESSGSIAKDHVTGLAWTMVPDNDYHDIKDARDRCIEKANAKYAGRRDWRLATVREFNTLIDYSTRRIFDVLGHVAGGPNAYITDTSCGSAYLLVFDDLSAPIQRSPTGGGENSYRCVSGRWIKAPPIANADGTVWDPTTGLMWSGTNKVMAWQDGLAYCEGLSLAGQTDWRMPNIRELVDGAAAGIVSLSSNMDAYTSSTPINGDTSVFSMVLDGGCQPTVNFGWSNTPHVTCVRSGCVPSNVPPGLTEPSDNACYSTTEAIECPAEGGDLYGQDGGYITNLPAFETPTSPGDELVVLDDNTGLVWQKSVDSNSPRSLAEAESYCQGLAYGGMTGWRLPSIREMATVLDYDQVKADQVYLFDDFNDQVGGDWGQPLWSISPTPGNAGSAYVISKSSLGWPVSSKPVESTFLVRCVTGCWELGPSKDQGDGTLWDPTTSLAWQLQPDLTARTWTEALAYCESLVLAGKDDWRLPDIRELVDISLSPGKWTGASIGGFWSGTPSPTGPTGTVGAWLVQGGFSWTNDHVPAVLQMNISTIAAGKLVARCVRAPLGP